MTNLGRVLPYGDAPFLGDMSKVHLNGSVLGSVATPSGQGYYMVASDGGIFDYSTKPFAGSLGGGLPPPNPIVMEEGSLCGEGAISALMTQRSASA